MVNKHAWFCRGGVCWGVCWLAILYLLNLMCFSWSIVICLLCHWFFFVNDTQNPLPHLRSWILNQFPAAVGGSEIPRPTTVWMYKTTVNNAPDKPPFPQLVSLPRRISSIHQAVSRLIPHHLQNATSGTISPLKGVITIFHRYKSWRKEKKQHFDMQKIMVTMVRPFKKIHCCETVWGRYNFLATLRSPAQSETFSGAHRYQSHDQL